MNFVSRYLTERRIRICRFERYDVQTLKEIIKDYELYRGGSLATRIWDRINEEDGELPKRRDYKLAKRMLRIKMEQRRK